jgi:hypothetical protein
MPRAELTIWLLKQCLALALFAKFWKHGLLRVYPAMSVYLLVSALRSLVLSAIVFMGPGQGTDLYADTYTYTLPLLWGVLFGVTWEIYSKVLRAYHGLSILGKRSMIVCLVVSAMLSIWTGSAGWDFSRDPHPFIRVLMLADAGVMMTFFLFLLVLALFVAWYPAPITPNLVKIAGGASVLFLGIPFGALVRNTGAGRWTSWASVVVLTLETACLLFWLAKLHARGERIDQGHGWRESEASGAVLRGMERLNEILEDSAKKKVY